MSRARSLITFDRVMTWSLARTPPLPARLVIATLVVVVVDIIRALVVTSLLPWLMFIPAVLLIALAMGRLAGLYAVLLSAILAGGVIAAPGQRYWLTGQQWVASIIYVLVVSGVAAIAGELRDAFRRLATGATDLAASNAMLVQREGQLELLNHELGHRLKNQLAIVQAVASQTLRQSGDLHSANEALASRLAALGRATDVLTRSDWTAADLHTLARTALASHQSVAGRFHFAGPTIRFDPQMSLALTLAFHELMTNAIKYGALSNDSGHVELSWSVGAGANADEPRFALRWQEVGGPEVRPPTRRGFGSVMIERSLRSYFRGDTAIAYEPAGLIFRIDAPLGSAQEG
ncbi:sensor histidine kinase [uncultured Sphingomonas sp.]|uniref:sensor histidine kinase n=1 Tax=uncultured Sphingomonas sp. TaxID=158754 RepID=UPI0035CBE7D9